MSETAGPSRTPPIAAYLLPDERRGGVTARLDTALTYVEDALSGAVSPTYPAADVSPDEAARLKRLRDDLDALLADMRQSASDRPEAQR